MVEEYPNSIAAPQFALSTHQWPFDSVPIAVPLGRSKSHRPMEFGSAGVSKVQKKASIAADVLFELGTRGPGGDLSLVHEGTTRSRRRGATPPKVHRSTRTATLGPIKSRAKRTNGRSRRSTSLARRGMEALKWPDGVSESARDQRAAVERNSPPGRYTAAHVFSGLRLVASIYQARRKPRHDPTRPHGIRPDARTGDGGQ